MSNKIQDRTQFSSYNYDGDILYNNPHICCQVLQSPTLSRIPASRLSARDGLGFVNRKEDTEIILASRVWGELSLEHLTSMMIAW